MIYLLLLFQGLNEIMSVEMKGCLSLVLLLRSFCWSPSLEKRNKRCVPSESGSESELELEQQTRQSLQSSGAHFQWGNRQQRIYNILSNSDTYSDVKEDKGTTDSGRTGQVVLRSGKAFQRR